MAKQRFEGVLNSAEFPMRAALQGRTVIQPTYDPTNRQGRQYYGAEANAKASIPQIVYCENVLPTAEGFQSVGYAEVVAAKAPPVTDFDQVISLRDADENNYLYSPALGKNYILNPTTLVWASTNPIGGITAANFVTRAYVNGRTFICYSGVNVYEYLAGPNTFLPALGTLPPGVVVTDIRGIAASSNYLIFFTKLTVYWSSLTDPTNFTPSLITGAGFATPQDVKARISSIAQTSNGFIIFTYTNAVGAQYSNNVRAPFIFKEITTGGGCADPERITTSQVSGPVYAWTTSGLQKMTMQGAEFVSPEVNDFIAGRMYDTWDPITGLVTNSNYAGPEFLTKLVLIANRWLVLSYQVTGGAVGYSHALVFDIALKRWGKIKYDHVDIFNFSLPTASDYISYTELGLSTYTGLGTDTYEDFIVTVGSEQPTSKQTFGLLKKNGSIQLLSMDYNKLGDHDAVIIFGKFQLVRARTMQHQLTTIEGAYENFACYIANSYDGYNMQPAVAMNVNSSDGQSTIFGKSISGLNFDIICTGTFALTSYVIETTNEGDD